MTSLSEELVDNDDRIDLTPMLDCVFVLLLFLIIATTFEENGLFKVELPKAAHATVRGNDRAVVLEISRAGQYAIDRRVIPDGELHAALASRFADRSRSALIIKGDRGCPYAQVALAVDMAQGLAIPEFSLVVAKP